MMPMQRRSRPWAPVSSRRCSLRCRCRGRLPCVLCPLCGLCDLCGKTIAHTWTGSWRSAESGTGSVRYVEWPADKKAIDIGSFYADSTKFKTATGWRPTVTLEDGLRRAIAFYRAHMCEYVPAAEQTERA